MLWRASPAGLTALETAPSESTSSHTFDIGPMSDSWHTVLHQSSLCAQYKISRLSLFLDLPVSTSLHVRTTNGKAGTDHGQSVITCSTKSHHRSPSFLSWLARCATNLRLWTWRPWLSMRCPSTCLRFRALSIGGLLAGRERCTPLGDPLPEVLLTFDGLLAGRERCTHRVEPLHVLLIAL